jgi:PAS domain S-box-containing protein
MTQPPDLFALEEIIQKICAAPEKLTREEAAALARLQTRLNQLFPAADAPSPTPPSSAGAVDAVWIESISDGLFSVDRDWNITYLNSRGAHNGTHNPQDLLGKNLWETFPSLPGSLFEKNYRKAMAEGIHIQFETKGSLAPDTWYLVNVYPSSQGLTVLALDNTTRKHTELEIQHLLEQNQHQNALLGAMFEADPNGLAVMVGPDLRFAYINPVYRYITPDPTLDPVGKPYAQVWPHISRHAARDHFRQVLETGRPYQVVGIEHSFQNGEKRLFTLQARRIFWDQQPACLLILWDITDQKRAENLNRALYEIGQALLSTLSFDDILKQAISIAASALGSESAALSLRGEDGWTAHSVFGLPENTVGLKLNDDQERHAVLAIQTKQPVAVSDAFNDPRVNREHLRKWGIRSVLVVPVLQREKVIGVIFFNYSRQPFKFEPVHIEFASQLAVSISMSLENARLYHDLSSEVTERQQTEASLRESEQRYRLLFENSLDGVLLTRPDGAILAANDQACRMFGMTEEEMVSEGRKNLVVYDEALIAALEHRTRTGWFRAELTNIRKDGSTFPTDVFSTVYPDAQGSPLTNMIIRDITERKQAENALRESERLYRSLYENHMDGVLLTRPDGAILSANPQACRMFGMTEQELIQAGRSGVVVADDKLAAALKKREQDGAAAPS